MYRDPSASTNVFIVILLMHLAERALVTPHPVNCCRDIPGLEKFSILKLHCKTFPKLSMCGYRGMYVIRYGIMDKSFILKLPDHGLCFETIVFIKNWVYILFITYARQIKLIIEMYLLLKDYSEHKVCKVIYLRQKVDVLVSSC